MNDNRSKVAFTEPEFAVQDGTIALHPVNLKLIESNQKLIASEKKRSELLANITHDLRSPIASIQGYLEYLLTFDKLDEDEVRFLMKQIHRKSLALDYLLNKLALLTSLDSSQEQVTLRPIAIKEYLSDFFYSCKIDKKYSKRKLHLHIPEEFPYSVMLDPMMFMGVLDNLFVNALKFSSQDDEITLEAGLKGKEVIISVADTGIGIDDKNLTLIFERSYMVSDFRTQSTGCGLGLSIAASVMEKHNGRIWCESTLGKGSTFYLSLPLYE